MRYNKIPYWRKAVDSLDTTGPVKMVTINAGCTPGKTMMHVAINSDGGYIPPAFDFNMASRMGKINGLILQLLPRKKKKAFKKLHSL